MESIVWELDSHLIGLEFDLGLEREEEMLLLLSFFPCKDLIC